MKYKMNTFEDKLRHKTRRIVLMHAAYGFLMAFLSVVCLLYALFIITYFAPQIVPFHIPGKLLIGLMVCIPLIAGSIAGYLERRDTIKLTLKLEKQYPQLADRLMTMIEISNKPEKIDQNPFSRMLAKSLEADMSRLIERFNFSGAAPMKKLILPAVILMVCLAAGSVQALVQPDFFIVSFKRLTTRDPHASTFSFFKKDEFQIKIIPGDTEISRGSNLVVQAIVTGRIPKQVEVHLKKANETAWEVFPMDSQKPGEFETLLSRIMQPCTYFVKVDSQESPVFQIKIFEAIRMERVMWNIEYPVYTKMQAQTRQGWGGKMILPRGTKLHLEIGLNQPVTPGWLMEQGKQLFEMKLKNPQVLEAEFEASRDMLLNLEIHGSNDSTLLEAPSLWIQTLPDLPPYLEVLEPQMQNYVFPTQEIPFEISVNDDYGLQSVTFVLHYQGKEDRIEWLSAGKTPDAIVLKPILRLEKFKLNPRDLIFGYIEVKDTHPGNDPDHIVKSPLFAFLIREYTEQYKINLPKSKTLSVRQYFEDIIAEQEKIMQDTWDYITQPPKEGPKGWEMDPEKTKGEKS